jgi:hypothetical protein
MISIPPFGSIQITDALNARPVVRAGMDRPFICSGLFHPLMIIGVKLHPVNL